MCMDLNKIKKYFGKYNDQIGKLEIDIPKGAKLDKIIESVNKLNPTDWGTGIVDYQNTRSRDARYKFCNQVLLYFIATEGELPKYNVKEIMEHLDESERRTIGIVTNVFYKYAKKLEEERDKIIKGN